MFHCELYETICIIQNVVFNLPDIKLEILKCLCFQTFAFLSEYLMEYYRIRSNSCHHSSKCMCCSCCHHGATARKPPSAIAFYINKFQETMIPLLSTSIKIIKFKNILKEIVRLAFIQLSFTKIVLGNSSSNKKTSRTFFCQTL